MRVNIDPNELRYELARRGLSQRRVCALAHMREQTFSAALRRGTMGIEGHRRLRQVLREIEPDTDFDLGLVGKGGQAIAS